MKIKSVEFKNIASYGNSIQKIEFDDKGYLFLTVGANGNGKCLDPNTEIEIEIEDEILLIKFQEFQANAIKPKK